MKKILAVLLVILLSFPLFSQESWENKKKMDRLKKEYLKAVNEYMVIYDELEKKQDKWNEIIEEKKQKGQWDYKNEKSLRDSGQTEVELLWSPFEMPENEQGSKIDQLIYKHHFSADKKKINIILEINNKQERLSRNQRQGMEQEMGTAFYSLVLKGYNATKNFLLILKEMEW